MHSIQVALWVVVLLVVLAVAFDFMNGFHDAANSIATVVSTGVLRPQTAVLFAAFFNVLAIVLFELNVAATVGKGIVVPRRVDHHMVFGALVGAIAWNVVTWAYGIPSSSSHALIGGILGAVIAKAGTGALVAAGILKIVLFIVLSPLLGFLLGSLMMVAVAWMFRRASPLRVDNLFRRLQLVSAGLYSLGHGGNDAQKTIGIIWMLLIATGHGAAGDSRPPAWVIWVCYLAIGLGTMFGGWRIVQARWARRSPSSSRSGGFCAETGGADHAVSRHCARRPGVDHAHHHRRDRRRGFGAARVGRALGHGRQHRVGLDLHDPGHRLHRRASSTGSASGCSPDARAACGARTRPPTSRRRGGFHDAGPAARTPS